LSRMALIAVTEDLIKEINSLIYCFTWKRNDKEGDGIKKICG